MKPLVTMRQALSDPELLGKAIPGDSWGTWRALLIASMGEELTEAERTLFQAVTGREREPLQRADELWAIVGRRGGKTRGAGVLGAYIAALCDWSDVLAPGERATLPILASSTYQAGRAFQHVLGVLQHSPVLSGMIEGEPTADSIRLSSRVDVQITPANFKTIRGVTAVGVIADELAFWQIEGSRNPDREILNAARPSLLTTGGPLVVISSPYARKGALYHTFRSDYGPTGDPLILVAKGASKTFNPTLPQREIDRAYERDAAVASAEYGGEFRTDVEQFVSREVVEACVDFGVFERAPVGGVEYSAFVDPSGGSSDSMTLAIAHHDKEADLVILDATREVKPPFSPKAVVKDFAELLKRYRIAKVVGDRYGGAWPAEVFSGNGITYEPATRVRSDLYSDALPLLNSGRARLLDSARLVDQFVGLERRTGRGKDAIDHGPNAHDDLANSVAGALTELVVSEKMSNWGLYELMRQQYEEACRAGRAVPRRSEDIARFNAEAENPPPKEPEWLRDWRQNDPAAAAAWQRQQTQS